MASTDDVYGLLSSTYYKVVNIIDTLTQGKLSYVASTIGYLANLPSQVTSLGDALATDTRTISNQVESARANVVSSVNAARDNINAHADVNTSSILAAVGIAQRHIDDGISKIDSTISDLGKTISDQVISAVAPVVAGLKDLPDIIANKVNTSIEVMGNKVIDKVVQQGEIFAQAVSNASDAIDRLTSKQDEIKQVIHEDLTAIHDVLKQSLSDHADILNKAIRESAFGISSSIASETAALGLVGTELAAAIAAGCTEIAGAIGASQAANKLMLAGKIAKDIEVGEAILSIVTLIMTALELANPESIALVVNPIVDSYMKLGKTLTESNKAAL